MNCSGVSPLSVVSSTEIVAEVTSHGLVDYNNALSVLAINLSEIIMTKERIFQYGLNCYFLVNAFSIRPSLVTRAVEDRCQEGNFSLSSDYKARPQRPKVTTESVIERCHL